MPVTGWKFEFLTIAQLMLHIKSKSSAEIRRLCIKSENVKPER